jgi:hypothetical protein
VLGEKGWRHLGLAPPAGAQVQLDFASPAADDGEAAP